MSKSPGRFNQAIISVLHTHNIRLTLVSNSVLRISEAGLRALVGKGQSRPSVVRFQSCRNVGLCPGRGCTTHRREVNVTASGAGASDGGNGCVADARNVYRGAGTGVRKERKEPPRRRTTVR